MSIEIYSSKSKQPYELDDSDELNIKFNESDFMIIGKHHMIMSSDVEALAILLVKFVIQSQLENLTIMKTLTFNNNLVIKYLNDKKIKIDCLGGYPEQWDKFKNAFEKYFVLKAFW